MKYQKIEPFESHLEQSLPNYPPPCYLLVGFEGSERAFLIKKIIRLLQQGEKKTHIESWSASLFSSEQLCHEISSPHLFYPGRIFLYDEIEKLTKEDFAQIAKTLERLPIENQLILSGLHLKGDPTFYDKTKRKGVMLDLSFEKPWEKKERFTRWLYSYVKEEGKSIDQKSLSTFIECSSLDFGLLLREMEKVVTFVGEEKTIDLDKIKEVCKSDLNLRGWELSEEMIWGDQITVSGLEEIDSSDFPLLLGQLRYHLRLGLSISTCLESNREQLIEQKGGKINKSKIERYKNFCKKKHSSYFTKGLVELFAIDRKWREGGRDPLSLLTFFLAKFKRKEHLLA